VLRTAGGLVFGGSGEGNFFALDAVTGWDFQTGGHISANPIEPCIFNTLTVSW
jgi:alcohol dehydrogenase (cytochrome c)